MAVMPGVERLRPDRRLGGIYALEGVLNTSRWAWFTVCIIWAVAFCFSTGLAITMLVNLFTGDEGNTLLAMLGRIWTRWVI
jgi:hypothetical protein